MSSEEDDRLRNWQEQYGDMVPERIIDTKVDENGRRYYKVQWADTIVSHGKNFLQAEDFIKKYWNSLTQQLDFPHKTQVGSGNTEQAGSSSSRCERDSENHRVRSDAQEECEKNIEDNDESDSSNDENSDLIKSSPKAERRDIVTNNSHEDMKSHESSDEKSCHSNVEKPIEMNQTTDRTNEDKQLEFVVTNTDSNTRKRSIVSSQDENEDEAKKKKSELENIGSDVS